MRFIRYHKLELFRTDNLPILMENEVCNNLPVSIISGTADSKPAADAFMGTVVDASGRALLIAYCMMPFNMLLYAPVSASGSISESIPVLTDELRRVNFKPPGVFADSALAQCFTRSYTKNNGGNSAIAFKRPMIAMCLEKLLPYKKAPGICRMLTEDDLSYVSLWEQEFCADCRIPAFSLNENMERIRTRVGNDNHFIWEDGLPVSQAVYGRETPNGAVINWVYTPPIYRGHGYATSVVGELCATLLERGKKFCCLFADADNPVSRGIYKKLGFYDVCEFLEFGF